MAHKCGENILQKKIKIIEKCNKINQESFAQDKEGWAATMIKE